MEKLEKNFQRLGLVCVADVPGRHGSGTSEIGLKMFDYDCEE
jgi:hydroxypyruvate isomerase